MTLAGRAASSAIRHRPADWRRLPAMAQSTEPYAFSKLPIVFEAGAHKVSVVMGNDWIWTCTVDGKPVGGRFMTQVEAWEAGVREADRMDRAASH
jgi:hypothetical protein